MVAGMAGSELANAANRFARAVLLIQSEQGWRLPDAPGRIRHAGPLTIRPFCVSSQLSKELMMRSYALALLLAFLAAALAASRENTSNKAAS